MTDEGGSAFFGKGCCENARVPSGKEKEDWEDLSNKKNRSFLRLLWAKIFLLQFLSFDTNALYFVRPLYIQDQK